jgi:hypothetical protein
MLFIMTRRAERKFTYVEMAYFQRWWDRLPESRREQVRMLYKRGQLEFNLGITDKHSRAHAHTHTHHKRPTRVCAHAGGISMNDEGVTTYYEEINQMSHGAAFLEKELGLTLTPRVLVPNLSFIWQ